MQLKRDFDVNTRITVDKVPINIYFLMLRKHWGTITADDQLIICIYNVIKCKRGVHLISGLSDCKHCY